MLYYHKAPGEPWKVSFEGREIHTLVCVTHDGLYHGDDTLAAAEVKILAQSLGLKFRVVRTRGGYTPEEGEMVITVDVGGVYDPNRLMFDHHQAGFNQKHANGKPLASSGLIWEKYGHEIVVGLCSTNDYYPQDSVVNRILSRIEHQFILAVDGRDCGEKTYEKVEGFSPYTISDIVSNASRAGRPFEYVVGIVEEMIRDLITVAHQSEIARQQIRPLIEGQEGPILVLNTEKFLPWQETVIEEHPHALFVVYNDGKEWKVQATPVELGSFKTRALLPATWAGLSGQELQEVCGHFSASFCHRGRWIAGFALRDQAILAAMEAIAQLEVAD